MNEKQVLNPIVSKGPLSGIIPSIPALIFEKVENEFNESQNIRCIERTIANRGILLYG